MSIVVVILLLSILLNGGLAVRLIETSINFKALKEVTPLTVVKEIEVVKRSICECGHESSKHTDKDGCREILFRTVDGVETNKSFYCRCVRYTGPEPLPVVYAPLTSLELEGTHV